ncbi:unnamed protein product (macronuclear) [Paramecium tetraurelia]|uniref:Uncharacterized protein n=1 Tax=Paramecium tetraurelia TaxID=5888 RepID=A0DLV1_PARTE|nr:uncharacterized protein GSPATT00039650001 [Paramecium tetraurelia]CAK84018.1 unnamed protein product [Paramecium tetraurelia]|eukprot:XP_001451415.1 hypothetical protein (macronuclear) [Paramecium tetraurelia strain d4-2]
MTILIVNDEDYLKSIEIKETDQAQEVAIRSDWIGGQIINTELSLQAMNDDITLLPFVSQDMGVLMDYYIYDVAKPFAVTFLQASNTVLSFKGNDLKNAQPLLPKLSDQYKCYRLEADITRLYSLCNNGVEDQIQVASCNDKQECKRENAFISAPFATQIIALNQDVVAVLHTDSLNPENYDGYITIHKLQSIDGIWSSTLLFTIDYQFIQSKLGQQAPKQFRPSSFVHSPTGNNASLFYLQLIITDSVNGLLFVDLTLSKTTSEVKYQFLEYQLLKDWLNVEQYASDDTHYYQAQIITQQIDYPIKKTVKLVLVTDISSSYVFELTFAIQANVSNKLSQIRTIFNLNRYGNFKTLNYVSASSSSIAIPYVKNLEVVIGVYKIPTDQENAYVQTIQGSHTFATFKKQITPQDFLIYNSDELFLTSTSTVGVYQNQVRYQQILKFGEPKKLHTQKLTLTFQNDFRRVVRTINLSIIPVDQDECQSKVTDLKIYPSQGEVLQWQLTQNLFDGVSLKYSVDTTDFSVVQAISQIGESINHKQGATQIVSAKALVTQNRAWSNQFGFLNKDGSKYSIFYTDTATINKAPSFNQIVNIKKTDANLNCLDFVQLSTNTFVVDCQIQNNKFLLLIKGTEEIQTPTITNSQLQRAIGTFQVKTNQFVIRVTLSITNEGSLANDSFIELFQYVNGQLQAKQTLDKSTLSKISGKQINQLNIVDFQIGLNGYFYLLDAKLGIISGDIKSGQHLNLVKHFHLQEPLLKNEKGKHSVVQGFNYYVQDLQFNSITYPQSIQASSNYIYVKNSISLFVYHSDDNNSGLIDIIDLTNGALIVNPFIQEIVTVSLKASARWNVSLGSLKFSGVSPATQEFKDLTITATSQHNLQCSTKIQYQVIESSSKVPIRKNKSNQPFPQVFDELFEQFQMGNILSGPNLEYGLTLPQMPLDFSAQVAQNRQIQVIDWPKSPIYSTELVANDRETLFQIFQTQDKKLTIQLCVLTDHVKYVCKDYGNVQLQEPISEQLFSIWQDNDNVVRFITISSLYKVTAYSDAEGVIIEETSVSFTQQEGQQILSILNQGDYLFILQKNGVLSSYWSSQFSFVNSITGNDLIGYGGQWKPLKLYGNRMIKSNIVFVQNENNIAIINYINTEFIFIQSMDYTQNNQIYISAAKNSFFLVNNKEILEYNYQNLLNIFKAKTVQLFEYSIASPLVVTSQLSTGNLVIKTTKAQDVYLNIYRPSLTQHDTFYLSFKLNGIKSDDQFQLSLGGSLYIITFANGQKIQQLNFILLNPELVIIPIKKLQKFVSNFLIVMDIMNGDDKTQKVHYEQNVKVANTMTNLIVNDEDYLKSIEINETDQAQEVAIRSDWIGGQIINTELSLQAMNDDITLLPFVSQDMGVLMDYYIYDVAKPFAVTFLQASNTVLSFKGNDLKNAQPLLPKLSDQYKCYRLEADITRLYSLCNNGVEDQIQVASCNDKQECKRENAFISAPFATQIIALNQDVVAVLHTDSLNPENYDGYITIHKLQSIDGIWSSTLLFTIDYQFIQSKLGQQAPKQFRPSSFVHSPTGNNASLFYLQLIITDSVNGLLFVDLTLSKTTSEVKYQFLEYQLLKDWLNVEQYASDDTHYYQAQIITQQIDYPIKKTVKLVLVTDISSSYVFELTFAIQANVSNKLSQIKTIFNLNRYGNFKTLNYVSASSSSIAIPYVKNLEVVIGVYKIPTDQENAYVQTIQGSHTFATFKKQITPQDFLIYNSDELFLTSTSTVGVYQNQVRYQQILKFGEPKKLHTQKLTLTFQNDFRRVVRTINLSIIPVDKDECRTKVTDLKIYPSQGEVLQWSLTQNLFDGTQLIFQYFKQYNKQENLQIHKQGATQIVSAKALVTQNRAWSNQFGFLNKDGSKYSIFYTDTASINKAPSFNQIVNIKKTDANLSCLDFVQLSTTTFVVDCQIQNNKLLLLIKGTEETQTVLVDNNSLNRVLGTYKLKDDHYVVRVSLSINAEGQLANNSFVELFALTNDGLVSKTTLDKTKLSNISGKQINQLNIVDFQIGLNGQIYLLDAKLGIFVVFFDTDWKFSRFIGFNFGQSFAFDRTVFSNSEEMFVIKGYNYYGIINYEGKVQKVQDLPFASLTYPQYIKSSEKYVFLHNQGSLYIYHFDDENSSLIDIVNVSNGAGIVNPNSQDIVTLSLTSSSAWTFGLGLLRFNGNAQASANFKAVTIQAKSQHNQVCYSRIYYQVLAGNSETIYKKVDTETPFPKVLDENDEQITLGSLVSGPNLIYEIVQPKSPQNSNNFLNLSAEPDLDVFAQIAHQRTIKVTNWPKKPLYQTSLVDINQETLYQVFQQEDKKVVIQDCELTDHVRYECKDQGNVQVKEQLSDQLFSIWQDSEKTVHFILLETPFIIKFFKIKNRVTVLYGTIKLNENEEKDELKAVAFQNQGNFLFVIQQNGDLSSYSTEKFTLINKVTGATLIGFQGDWKPIKLYGNRVLRQNVIFVQNENNVAIINYSNQEFIYGSKVDYTKGNQIYITSSTNSFFFVNNKELSEYNYEKINNVFKQKTVELFGYQIVNPLGVSSHLQTGILVIRTTKNDNVYLNIYKPGLLQHDTFYLAVKINAKVDDTFAVSASGSDPIGSAYILTLANGETVQQLDFIVLDPQLILIPNKQKQKYLTDYEISINVKNADSLNNLLPFKQTVKVINTFTNLIVDDKKSTQSIDIEPLQNSTTIKLDNDWISGQEPYCTLLQQKTNNIFLQSYLHQTKNYVLQNYYFKDTSAFQNNVVLQATKTVLLMKDNKLEESKPILDALGEEYDCFRITSYEKSLYSLCNNGVEDQILVANCNDKQECKRENAFISAPSATQIIALAQDVVAVLHTDSLNPENYDGYITIHKLQSMDGIWSSTLLFTIDYQFIQSKLGQQTPKQFRPSSFVHSVTHSEENSFAVQFIISDSVNGLLFVDVSITKATSETKFIYIEYLLLNKWLNENKQYANDQTHYYSNKIIDESIKDKTKSVTIVVVTDNASSYVFTLQFAISDNHSNKLTDTKVKVALNRYGTWKALNTVAANKESVIVSFINKSKVVVGVYHITDSAVSVIRGSFSFTIGTQKLEPSDFPLHLQGSTLISSKISKGLNQYEIRKDISLYFGESANLQNQTLTITFSNDYRSVSKSIQLNIKPDNGGDDDNGSSSKAWWIILIIVGSVVFLGLIGFLFFRKKRDQDDDSDDQESGLMHVN